MLCLKPSFTTIQIQLMLHRLSYLFPKVVMTDLDSFWGPRAMLGQEAIFGSTVLSSFCVRVLLFVYDFVKEYDICKGYI